MHKTTSTSLSTYHQCPLLQQDRGKLFSVFLVLYCTMRICADAKVMQIVADGKNSNESDVMVFSQTNEE